MKKNLLFIICALSLGIAPAVGQAKKSGDFALPVQKEFKAQNVRVLSAGWETALKPGSPSKRYYPETNSPALGKEAVYIGTQAGLFYAVDRKNGKILWTFENDEGIAATAGL